jgi:hypothetical protein
MGPWSHTEGYYCTYIHNGWRDVLARLWWLTPVILATQEAEIRRITVGSQPGQTVGETLSRKNSSEKKKKKKKGG